MGTGRSRGFSDLGQSPGLLLCCLSWVTQPLWAPSLRSLLLLCKSLPYMTCFTDGGSSWCSQHPHPTPFLRPLRPPLHRLFAKKLEAASPTPGALGHWDPRGSNAFSLGTSGHGVDHMGHWEWPWMASYCQPCLSCYKPGLFLCALLNFTQRPKIYSSKSAAISLHGGQEAVPGPASLGKHTPLFMWVTGSLPAKHLARWGKGRGTRWTYGMSSFLQI